MSMQEGSNRILHLGIATGVTGIIGVTIALVFKDDIRQVAGYLFVFGCGMAIFGVIFTVIGYIVQGFAKP